MNYFEHHIGDYDKNTAHLSACEDGIYHRMLRRYYDKERPLDPSLGEVQRVVRARTREEKTAVASVLKEFFRLEADGWHHDKCDEQLQEFFAGAPEREAKKANEDNRLKRHREERARLFKIITDAGEHAPWNIQMKDLREIVERITGNGAATAPATANGNAPETAPATQPATATATPATATQTPIPNSQSPLPIVKEDTPLTPQGGRRARKASDDSTECLPGFDAFYAAYPRKVGRGAAVKAWARLAPDEALQATILGALAAQKPHLDRRENGRYIPHPATWLNAGQWDDEIPGGKPAPVNAAGQVWWQIAGFGHVAEAQNDRCHIGNYHEFRDGKRVTQGASA